MDQVITILITESFWCCVAVNRCEIVNLVIGLVILFAFQMSCFLYRIDDINVGLSACSTLV